MSEILKIYDIEKIIKLNEAHSDYLQYIDAVRSFVFKTIKKMDTSKLSPLETNGHETYFSKLYNAWVSGKKMADHEFSSIADHLAEDLHTAKHLLKSTNSYQKNKETLEKFYFENLHKTFVDLIWHRCSKCEEQHSLFLKDGKYTLLSFLNKKPFTACGVSKKSARAEIKLKTGNLLIMDFFRSEGSPQLFSVGKHGSVNTEKGRIERTALLLKKHQMLSIFVGNSSPAIFQKGNSIIFPQDSDTVIKGYQKKGKVITDMWWVSIIEEETLLKALINSGKKEKTAKNEIAELKKQWFVNSIKVKPGKYIARFPVQEEYVSKYHKEKFPNKNITISLEKKGK